jgi:uncharacterized protein
LDSPNATASSVGEGTPRVLYKHRAVLISEDFESDVSTRRTPRKYLVVSDLHIGFEEKFRGAGVALEPQIKAMLTEITQLIEDHKITDVLVAGDVKSGVDRILPSEWDNVPKFFDSILARCRASVIPGNHDGGLKHILPAGVELLDINGTLVGGNLILHGHTRPLRKFSNCKRIFMGHLHPIFQKRGSPLSGQPVWVFLKPIRAQVFGSNSNIVPGSGEESTTVSITVIPSFNLELIVAGYAADAAKQERKVAPILRDLRTTTEAMVMTLDGDLIGDQSILPRVLA